MLHRAATGEGDLRDPPPARGPDRRALAGRAAARRWSEYLASVSFVHAQGRAPHRRAVSSETSATACRSRSSAKPPISTSSSATSRPSPRGPTSAGSASATSATRGSERAWQLLAARGWLRGYVLYLDEQPIAFELGELYRGRFDSLAGAYDPDYGQHRVGAYLLLKAIEDLGSRARLRLRLRLRRCRVQEQARAPAPRGRRPRACTPGGRDRSGSSSRGRRCSRSRAPSRPG